MTTLKFGWSDPLTDTFGAHPLMGNVLDLNDGQTFTLLSPSGLELSAPTRTMVPAGNIRTQGESVVKAIYRHNREAHIQVLLGPAASYAALVTTIRTLLGWLNAAPVIPFAVQWQPFGASEPGYLDVVGAAHNIPSSESQWLRLQVEPIDIVLIVRPGIRYPRQTLSNLALNPGFSAGSGPGVAVFNDALANVNAYASQAGSAPTVGTVNNGFADVVMSDAPIRYYRCQEASGTTAYDVSGNAQNGTYVNAPTLGAASGVSGESNDKAVTYASASSQRMGIPNTGLWTGNAACSMEAAVKIAGNPAANAVIVEYGATGNHNFIHLVISSTGVPSVDVGSGTAVTGAALSLNVWHLIGASWDGTTLRLYVDGAAVGTPTTPGNQTIAAGGVCNVGASVVPNSFLSATIDEISLYTTALAAARFLAHWNAFNAGTGMGTTAAVMTLVSGARIAFGSPDWGAINTWQARFRFQTGLTMRWYLHYTDASNYLRASLTATALTIEHVIAGVTTTLATTTILLDNLVWYWLKLSQFPAPSGDPSCVQAFVYNDQAGAASSTVAFTAGPIGTQDAITALSGRPQIEASGASLLLGGPSANVHAVYLFGPGGWTFVGNGAAGLCSGAWELDTTKTYPNGPITSVGAARIDLPPAGAIDASWRLYTGGSPTGQLGAVAVASAGDTLGFRVRYASNGISGTGSIQALIREYDASGTLLRTGAAQTGGNTALAWSTLQNLLYVTGANCAYVDLALRVVDASAGASANGSVWFDNVQLWNVTKSGQADMPYCELRFAQSPAQLLVTGLLGDLPAPTMFAFATYLASFAPGAVLNFAVGRRAQFSPNAIMASHVHGYYGTALTPTAVGVLDATSFGGYYAQATVQTSWNPRVFSLKPTDLKGLFHLWGRFLSKQLLANIANVQLRAVSSQQNDPWFNNTSQSDVLANYYGPFASLFTASNAWTVCDTGQINLPPYNQGAMTDPTATYLVPRAQWTDSTVGGALGQSDWEMLLPIDGSLLVGVVNNPANAPYTPATSWLWLYFDGLLTNRAAIGDGPAWLYSLETASLAAPSKGAGGPGTQGTGFVNVNSGADPYLTVDPGIGNASWPGANQMAAFISDASGGVYPFMSDVVYSPLYLEPR